MNRARFVRRDLLIVGALLAITWLAGTLYAYDLLPDVICDVVKFGLLPVWVLVHELQVSVVWGGIDGVKEVFCRTYRPDGPTIAFVWDVGIIIIVSYFVALVSVHVGEVGDFGHRCDAGRPTTQTRYWNDCHGRCNLTRRKYHETTNSRPFATANVPSKRSRRDAYACHLGTGGSSATNERAVRYAVQS